MPSASDIAMQINACLTFEAVGISPGTGMPGLKGHGHQHAYIMRRPKDALALATCERVGGHASRTQINQLGSPL
jgi:hypothetical protein